MTRGWTFPIDGAHDVTLRRELRDPPLVPKGKKRPNIVVTVPPPKRRQIGFL